MMKIDYKIAWSAATDAANSQMRKAGRSSWNESDYNLACESINDIMGYEAVGALEELADFSEPFVSIVGTPKEIKKARKVISKFENRKLTACRRDK